MDDAPATRASLLLRLRDSQDTEAWREFVRLYAPVVYGFARKRGLQDADAADLMQEVFRSVAGAAGRLEYDPRRGSFRGWLYTVTRNKLYTFLNRRKRQPGGSGGADAQELLETAADAGQDLDALWNQEYERRLASWAMAEVRGEFSEPTWQAFHLTAVENRSPQEVARQLGLSPGSVYVAKSRVLARVRAKVRELQGE